VAVVVLLFSFSSVFSAKIGSVSFKEKTFKNGLKVFVARTTEVPMFSFYLVIPAGSAMDEAGKEGQANLTAGLLLKGADGMSAEEIANAIESLGGNISTNAGTDYTVISGDFMSKDLSFALDYLAKVVLKPDFPAEEVEREKKLVISGIRSTKENPSAFATRQFFAFLAEGHPYGHPVSGYESSVSALTRDDVVGFYKKYYQPSGAILAIVGDVRARKVFKEVSKRFGGWKGSGGARVEIPAINPDKKVARKVIVIDKPDATQSQIRIGCYAPPVNNPDYFALTVANNILGGGFTSRLMEEIRVNRGLTYGARSFLSQYARGGFFGVTTFTKNKTLRETIDVALTEVKRIGTEPVDEKELEKAKKYLSGLYPFELETNDHLARTLARVAFYSIPLDYVNKYRELVGKVSSGDIMNVAKKYFHADNNLILLITNYAETKDQLEGLGPVEVIPIDEVKN